MKQKHIHYHFHLGSGLPAILSRLDIIMTTVQELAPQIDALTAQVAKIGTETRSLITKVQDLTDALASTPRCPKTPSTRSTLLMRNSALSTASSQTCRLQRLTPCRESRQ